MIWSKLKKTVEALFAGTVKEHLQVHLTHYGSGEGTSMNGAWLTWDGEEVNTFSTTRWLRERNVLSEQSGTIDVLAKM